MFHVYELINEESVIEYVGCTSNTEDRFYKHTKCQPLHSGTGLFYGRTDLKLRIVKTFSNRKDALNFEGQHKIANGFEWTERKDFRSRADVIRCSQLGGRANALCGGYKIGAKALHREYTCPFCSRTIKGGHNFKKHTKVCSKREDK